MGASLRCKGADLPPWVWLLLTLVIDTALVLAGSQAWDTSVWMRRIAQLHGGGYATAAAAAMPLGVHWLWLCARLLALLHVTAPAAVALRLLLLAPLLLAHLLLLLLTRHLLRSRRVPGGGGWLLLLAALNPALLLEGPLMGGSGLLYGLPLAAALYLLVDGRLPLLVLPLLLLALSLKPGCLCLLPVLLPLLWHRRSPLLWAGLLPALLLAELVLLPYWLAGSAGAMLHAVYVDGVAFDAQATAKAHNLWHLLGLGQAGEGLPMFSPARLPAGLGWLLTPRSVGETLFGLWGLCLLLSSWRTQDAERLWRNALLSLLGAFLLLPAMQSGDLLPAVVLALPGAARYPRLAWHALALTLLAALDLLLVPGLLGDGALSRLLSAALLAYGFLWLLRSLLPRAAPLRLGLLAAPAAMLVLLFWTLRTAPPPAAPAVPVQASGAWLDATRIAGRSNTQGWGSLHIDQSVEGRPLMSGGKPWPGGFGTHAPSIIQLPVPPGAARFTASAGLDDEVAGGHLSFQVFADRQLLWDSGAVNSGEAPRALDVDVSGRSTLELVVDPLGDNSYDHADWLQPRFVMRQ